MNWDDHRRMAVACAECGAVYVAVERNDGTIHPIGSSNRCNSCGAAEFEPITDAIFGDSSESASSD